MPGSDVMYQAAINLCEDGSIEWPARSMELLQEWCLRHKKRMDISLVDLGEPLSTEPDPQPVTVAEQSEGDALMAFFKGGR
jgi:hypothetical protein